MNAFNVVRTPSRPFGCGEEVIVETFGGCERRKGVSDRTRRNPAVVVKKAPESTSTIWHSNIRSVDEFFAISELARESLLIRTPPRLNFSLQSIIIPSEEKCETVYAQAWERPARVVSSEPSRGRPSRYAKSVSPRSALN